LFQVDKQVKDSTKAANNSKINLHSKYIRFPLQFNIVISLVKYWYRLVNLSNESKLLHNAYICSKNVANEGKQSWFLFTEKLLKGI
jgi:hypothetical protein